MRVADRLDDVFRVEDVGDFDVLAVLLNDGGELALKQIELTAAVGADAGMWGLWAGIGMGEIDRSGRRRGSRIRRGSGSGGVRKCGWTWRLGSGQMQSVMAKVGGWGKLWAA